MTMEAINSAKNLIEKYQDILILPSPELQGDGLGSALALSYTLKKIGKNANAKIDDIPEKFKFLANNYCSSPGDFVVRINTEGKDISQMRYEKNGGDLKIYLTMDKGNLSGNDVSFLPFSHQENPNYGLVITLGVQSLENVPKNLWHLPIINIDNQPQNENFGQVNLIEMTCSLAEIATNLIREAYRELLDKDSATCLLTGVIWSSQNFRNPKTRPKTFETSAFLIEKGADHQEIIRHLYKQKSIAQIKLLGKILENLNFYEPKDIYTAAVKEEDFNSCQASSKDLAFVLEELKFHFRHLPNLLILWESHASPPLTKGVFCSPNADLTEKILENFEGASKGAGTLFLIREVDLNIAKEKVLNIL